MSGADGRRWGTTAKAYSNFTTHASLRVNSYKFFEIAHFLRNRTENTEFSVTPFPQNTILRKSRKKFRP